MQLYPLFVLMAAATVASPGPGVVMSLSNALRFGWRGSFGGICGIAFGALVVAALSATSLGVLLAASATAFTVLKWLGAAYLIFLGIKLWRAPALHLQTGSAHEAKFARRFVEGVSLQLTNPKAIFFFLAIFPQFIQPEQSYAPQFALLVLTYSGLILIIHSLYALFAQRARNWFASERGGKLVNRSGALTFILFGVLMARAQR